MGLHQGGDGEIRLSPHHDIAAYAAAFAADGRVHIPGLLREADARRLHAVLANQLTWNLHVIHNGMKKMPLSHWESIPEAQKQALEASLAQGAGTLDRFEARFLSHHVSKDGEPFEGDIPELAAIARFLNGPEFLSFARAVTGDAGIRLTDAQATCYRAGDFLHGHNDHAYDAHRVAAYVLNLTPEWRAEWGGLLNFPDEKGHVTHAYTPAWNALNFLKVPQLHFVGSVAPFVTARRLSVTGWVRRT